MFTTNNKDIILNIYEQKNSSPTLHQLLHTMGTTNMFTLTWESITILGKQIILLVPVNSISPGHNRKIVLQFCTPITGEGDSLGFPLILLEGEGALLEGNKYLLGCQIDTIFILLAVNKHSFFKTWEDKMSNIKRFGNVR